MVLYIGTESAPLRGIFLLAGLVLFWGLGFWQGKKRGFDTLTLVLASVLTPLLSVFCAHFFYRLVNLAYDPPAFAELFALWQNGHMLYGGLIGSLLALWCCGGKRALRLMDAYAPSMALMIAFFRLSEGFAGQGYGEYVYEETFLCRFPFMMYDPSYELWAWALFMAEALVALVLFAALLCRKDRRDGDGILLLLGLFAAAQIVLESLRRDEFLRWGFVRCEELFSALTVGAVLFGYQRLSKKGKALQKSLCWVFYLLLVVFCILLEFATEGRIPFLRFLDVEGCYGCMVAACVGLMGCVLWMRSFGAERAKTAGKGGLTALCLTLALLTLPALSLAEGEALPRMNPVTFPEISYTAPENAKDNYKPDSSAFGADNLSYHDDSIDVQLHRVRVHDTDVAVAFIQIANAAQIRSELAKPYPQKATMRASVIAQKVNAVFAINADWFTYHDAGIIYRNGVLLREREDESYDGHVIDDQGDFHIVSPMTKENFAKLERPVLQSFAFGPALVLNGEAQTFPDRKVTYAQRVAIGQIDRLKYVVAVSDGYMQENSTGLTMDQMAQLMQGLGSVTAYNLDGGQSSSMIMHNIKMNADSKVMRAVGDILYFVTAIPND